MQPKIPKNMPYVLLGRLGQTAALQGLPINESAVTDPHAMQELTTAYITTQYYAALANLYMQTTLPDNRDELDKDIPRVKIAFERTYADFTSASTWLAANGGEYILSSAAKQLYDEVQGMDKTAVKDTAGFYIR